MGGSVHSLQETIAAVIDTVQHVRKVIVVLAAHPIAFGGAQHPLAELVGNDKCGLLFLQAKILVLGIEYFGIAITADLLRSRKAGQDLLCSRVIGDLAFYVDGLDHAGAGRL